ncbi:MAG TPA: amino acid aminotransferase [Casimicrobiaceae bacterium]|nr:amino acid aminotransferase [Casimicrobiaceae bacterium]
MNATVATSLFGAVDMAPRDPILGVTESFLADRNPNKVNLGVGVYCDDDGKVPLLECVRIAEAQLMARAAPHTYLPIDGIQAYDRAVRDLLLGPRSRAIEEKRVVTVQSLGGTGALKVGADFLKRYARGASVWISDPSWENHRALFEGAGFAVGSYPYYDPTTRGLAFDAMLGALDKLPAGAIVVLHACCHNPTGVDLDRAQWTKVLDLVRGRSLVPFLDIAYQGFGDGVNADGDVVRRFAETEGPLFIASSFSKSFSLYGERVGAVTIVTDTPDEASRVLSQVKRVVRASYSNPPSFGGQIVTTVLDSAELRASWDEELGSMRERIKAMRRRLVDALKVRLPQRDFDFMLRQRGMFSYSGLSKDQVARLRSEFSIYAVDSGRICVAALNSRNIDYVADAIGSVAA